MKRSDRATTFEPTGFFVLRSPLLPVEEHDAWSRGLEGPATETGHGLAEALEKDRTRLRRRLRQLFERPEIDEALFLASPSLHRAVGAWRREPEGPSAEGIERSLVRYFLRMTARPTPFGLFSGCSTGKVAQDGEGVSRLCLAPRSAYRRSTRLDMDYLVSLAAELERTGGGGAELRYSPASTLYEAGGTLRYVEVEGEGGRRRHRLVGVEPSDPLARVLDRAGRDPAGATVEELVRVLVTTDPDGDLPEAEAERFVYELIATGLLEGGLEPSLTGRPPLDELMERLGGLDVGDSPGRVLAGVAAELEEIDRHGLGIPTARYGGIARALDRLPAPVDPNRLVQVDLFKPIDGGFLGREVIEAVREGVETLERLAPVDSDDPLASLRRELLERYGEGRRVPLTDALDEDAGIGFGTARTADPAPLLEGLGLSPAAPAPRHPWGAREILQLRKLEEALAGGRREVELSDRDLEPFASGSTPPLPDAFQAAVRIAAAGEDALRTGRFRILLESIHGPSGARLVGRFAHADPDLQGWIRRHLEQEEALQPDTLFAEVVHLPHDRLGNVTLRPVLRGYEIPFLGRSGAPPERRLAVRDLTLSVEAGRLVLRSSRHGGRRVAPRLTTAHNYLKGVPLYRLLCSLQSEGKREAVTWGWGVLGTAPFLPRVRRGRTVLARALWNVTSDEIAGIARHTGLDRVERVRAWRERRRLPRRVVLVEGDHELPVDLENVLELDALLDQCRGRSRVRLLELFPAPDELPVRGPEGRFHHQVMVPFVRSDTAPGSRAGSRPALVGSASCGPAAGRRRFPPGSAWLDVRLFAGAAACDRILVDTVAPLVRRLRRDETLDDWFFVRYGDPSWHLRLRFHGRPEHLAERVRPRLERAAAGLLDRGRAWRLQLDTYEREVERFGGFRGIGLAERMFGIDSDAVLEVLESTPRPLRWRAALAGCHRLLENLGIPLERAVELSGGLQESFAREHAVDSGIRRRMADRMRAEQEGGRDLLALSDPAALLAGAGAALDRRSRKLAPVAAELRRREASGELERSVEEIGRVLVHLHANRVFRSRGRLQEVVLYDFLHRLLRSRAARAWHEERRHTEEAV